MDRKTIAKIIDDFFQIRQRQIEVEEIGNEVSNAIRSREIIVPNTNYHILSFIVSFLMDKYKMSFEEIRKYLQN